MVQAAMTFVSVRRAARGQAKIVNGFGSVADPIVEVIGFLRCLPEEPIQPTLGWIVSLHAKQLVAGWLETDSCWCCISDSTVLMLGTHDLDMLIPISMIGPSLIRCGVIGCLLVDCWTGHCGSVIAAAGC